MQEIDWSRARIRKISVRLGGHATSVSLEEPFVQVLKTMAENSNITLTRLVTQIDEDRPFYINLSSALRLAVLAFLTKDRLHPRI